MTRTSPPLLAAALLLAGCASDGAFPSLGVREAERVYASGDPLQTTPEAPDRAGLAGRIAGFVAAANEGEAVFTRALAAARPIAARAGTRGSESWLAAQQAISRAEAARAATTKALGDLDQFSAEQARQGPLSTSDFQQLTEATSRLQAQADRQRQAVEQLR
jgi:hypothetical protein